ncbi:Fe-S cluster assembly protein SufD [Aquabacter spiritensis]|uniref:Iron-regulated ABC transporter permease protein SufD n=1 Tax=Aquabacter spiritensis TaxID=933073 RepID=A0A4R3LMY6_9HYPH|nr:Fe-S cluster assembly protein SufD [Aquabacter spiritensis]TCT01694.1 iron-regulated ABC transporter permease protein SufD [Aquabacter spiritensis]
MNAIPAIRTKAEQDLGAVFASAGPRLPGGRRIAAARAAAFQAFAAAGLPHRRLEAWKYTDLRRLMRDAKPLAAAPDAVARAQAGQATGLFSGLGFRRLLVVDGVFVADQSDLSDLEPGLEIRAMRDLLAADVADLAPGPGSVVPEGEPMLALNAALAGDGVQIRLAPGTRLARPIHLAFRVTAGVPAAMFTRSAFEIGAGGSATLLETFEGPDGSDYQVNAVLDLRVGDDARLDHVRLIGEGDAALHVGTAVAEIGARAAVNAVSLTCGGGLVRSQAFVTLAGADTRAAMSGASLLGGRQHADTTLVIAHAAPGSESRETFKAVVDGAARSAFQGRITVRQAAQQTDARMMARALLLSEAAEAHSKPELEIFADDVQCGHGATVGALDEQLKFYLMARGIPAPEAEALLIQAFVGEVIDAVADDGIREALTKATAAWLRARG